ncbi:hypothetical protein SAMN05421504_113148 [Amycolatopsis xylanica]|uniref:Uncharacterized protein n=1 Tax=Amycolatopsis xylanica TaxID=589385 RepID=A0A1H3SEM7_9PSEU|nr:hypothetical protein SAMN05421504_113148 [Amycolatopsis xylanica]
MGTVLLTQAQPAAAADPITFTDKQLSSALFGAAVRVKDSGPEFDKHVIGSAELLDWRAKHPAATAADTSAHTTAIQQAMDTGFSAIDAQRSRSDQLGRLLEIVYAAPGAELSGPELTGVLGVLTARDLAPGTVTLHVGQRLSGAEQQYGLSVAYSLASTNLWNSVYDRTKVDAVLSDAWKGEFGKPTAKNPEGLNPAWTFSDLKKFGALKDLVNIDALITAGKAGAAPFYDELRKQFNKMRDTLNGENNKVSSAINDLLAKAGFPGAPNGGPSKADLDKAKEREKAQQEKIDGIKGGLDVVVALAKYIDTGFAKHLASFVETVYKVATAVNTLYTSIATLAVSTGIGAGTFGVIGAIAGAAIGLIQAFAGLVSGPDRTQEIQLAVIKEVRNGFAQMREYVEKVYNVMNTRFDRIEKGLNTIYQTMLTGFDKILAELEKVDKKLDGINDVLIKAVSDLQGFNLQILNGVSDVDKQAFFEAADRYVDYAVTNNGMPLQNYEGPVSYLDAVSKFAFAAKTTARNNNFTFGNYQDRNLDNALRNGPVGAIDYLAARAGLPAGGPDDRVPNADLWAQAARAYTLTAIQNPAFAAKEGNVRADQIVANGKAIRDAAQRFSAPVNNPNAATNPLFAGLLNDNAAAVNAFTTATGRLAKDPVVMAPERQFDLFADVTQDIDVNKLPAPSFTKVGPCSGAGTVIDKPDFLTGKNLPKAAMFGQYLNPQWQYRSCWLNPAWSADPYNAHDWHWETINGEKIMVYVNTRLAPHQASFWEIMAEPGTSGTVAQGVVGHRNIPLCSWKSYDEPSDAVPANCRDRGDATAAMSSTFGTPDPPIRFDFAHVAAANKELAQRRASFYDLVASQFSRPDALPETAALKDNMRLLKAYTDLGFPRAKETDDQLRALVYGTNSLTNLPAIYTQEAANLRAGKAAVTDNPLLDKGADGSVCVLTGPDTLTNCIRSQLASRKDRAAGRFELQFRNILSGQTKETLPLVDEAIRNIELTSRYFRAR